MNPAGIPSHLQLHKYARAWRAVQCVTSYDACAPSVFMLVFARGHVDSSSLLTSGSRQNEIQGFLAKKAFSYSSHPDSPGLWPQFGIV